MLELLRICSVLYLILLAWKVSLLRRDIEE